MQVAWGTPPVEGESQALRHNCCKTIISTQWPLFSPLERGNYTYAFMDKLVQHPHYMAPTGYADEMPLTDPPLEAVCLSSSKCSPGRRNLAVASTLTPVSP